MPFLNLLITRTSNAVSPLTGKNPQTKKFTAVKSHMLFSDHIVFIKVFKFWQPVTQISKLMSKSFDIT